MFGEKQDPSDGWLAHLLAYFLALLLFCFLMFLLSYISCVAKARADCSLRGGSLELRPVLRKSPRKNTSHSARKALTLPTR